MNIELLITDDHAIVRAGLKELLAFYDDITTVAEAINGSHLLELLETITPSILTVDIMMPGLNGIELIHKLKEKHPNIPVLVLSMCNEAQLAKQAIRAGANGYLSKDCDAQTFIKAIRKIAAGGRYIQEEIAEKLAFELDEKTEPSRHQCLSKREYSIFCLLAEGKKISDIADRLFISKKTVSTHKFRIMQKMRFESTAELVRYALAHKII